MSQITSQRTSHSTTNQELGLTLPDIAREERVEMVGRLDQVGMSNIEVPLLLINQDGEKFRLPARAQAFVSLDDPHAKGIHMSRLFLQLQEGLTGAPLSLELLDQLLGRFIETHRELSHSSFISVSFDYMVERPALKSQNKGWRSYPMIVSAHKDKAGTYYEIDLEVTYSSTCPCSAALARQLIQDQFRLDFKEETLSRDQILQWIGSSAGIVATPHSQRSKALVKLRFNHTAGMNEPARWATFVDKIESCLGTPVQAAVKREDEQEFALLNGQNLMFCEDAARKIKSTLNKEERVTDFWVKVSHLESLHPHDAVSVVTKGVTGGYQA